VRLKRYSGAREYLAAVEPWLRAAEPDNNVLLSLARLLKSDDHPFREPYFYAALFAGDRIVGTALRPPPDQLELSSMPEGAARLLVADAAAVYPRLHAVAGPPAPALEFAESWVAARGGAWRLRHRWSLHVARTVSAPRPCAGFLRRGTDGDGPLLGEWGARYGRELDAPVDVPAFFARMLRRGSLFVWDHDGPRCAVAVAGFTPNGARIAAVYTPEEYRNRGYASNAVAAVTRELLDAGREFCVLFADFEHETPMRIYRSLGFQPLRDNLLIDIRAPGEP
jgi:GNAT superfamily N-acetyltransferase